MAMTDGDPVSQARDGVFLLLPRCCIGH